MLIQLIEANRQLFPLQKDKLQTKHNEHFYKCTLKKIPTTNHGSPIFLQTQFKKKLMKIQRSTTFSKK